MRCVVQDLEQTDLGFICENNSGIGIGVLLDLEENGLHGCDDKSTSEHGSTVPDENNHVLETATRDGVVLHIRPVIDERYQQKTGQSIDDLRRCQAGAKNTS